MSQLEAINMDDSVRIIRDKCNKWIYCFNCNKKFNLGKSVKLGTLFGFDWKKTMKEFLIVKTIVFGTRKIRYLIKG